MNKLSSNRRDMLKLGVLAAVPGVVLAPQATPIAAPTPDPSMEGAYIAALIRDAVRRFNTGGAAACADLTGGSKAITLPAQVTALRLSDEAEADVAFAEGLDAARWSQAAVVVREKAFDGETTLERMARFQGQPATRSEQAGLLTAELSRTSTGWAITRLAFA